LSDPFRKTKGTDSRTLRWKPWAKRRADLLNETTAGDTEIEPSRKRLQEEGALLAAHVGSKYALRPVWSYRNQAIAAAKRSA
jgi:hypothetical protein